MSSSHLVTVFMTIRKIQRFPFLQIVIELWVRTGPGGAEATRYLGLWGEAFQNALSSIEYIYVLAATSGTMGCKVTSVYFKQT